MLLMVFRKMNLYCIVFSYLLLSSVVVFADARRVQYKKNSFDFYRVSPAKNNIHFYWKNSQGDRYFSFKRLKEDLHSKKRTLLFATNAGIFEWGYSPLGLYVEKGRTVEKLNRRSGKGNFYAKPNGVFYISKNKAGILSTYHFSKARIKPRYATQSGPMLVRRNLIHRFFRRTSSSRKIRNGVGIDSHGRMVFVISRTPVNMYEFAEFFKRRMRCSQALYLDGNISQMYLPAIKRYDLSGNFAVIIAVSKKNRQPKKRGKPLTKPGG